MLLFQKSKISPLLAHPLLMPVTSFSPSMFRVTLHQFPCLVPISRYSCSINLSLILQTCLLCLVLKANKNRSRTNPFSFQSYFLKVLSAFSQHQQNVFIVLNFFPDHCGEGRLYSYHITFSLVMSCPCKSLQV